jgi:hypothetical protein
VRQQDFLESLLRLCISSCGRARLASTTVEIALTLHKI